MALFPARQPLCAYAWLLLRRGADHSGHHSQAEVQFLGRAVFADPGRDSRPLRVFLGNEIRTLQPVLDSYWRPIHVSIATIGYGVCLVSFGLAFAYLLKDGVRSEAIAIAVGLFGLLVYGTIGGYGVRTTASMGHGLLSKDRLAGSGGAAGNRTFGLGRSWHLPLS